MLVLLNVAILYAAWFGTVLLAARGQPVEAACASLLAVAANLAISRQTADDFRLVWQAALVGVVFDGVMINLGLAQYASPGPVSVAPPVWLVTLWMAFATTLNVSLGWLKERLLLGAILGALGGPISYYAGARLGGMTFAEPFWLSVGVLALLWAITFPILLILARRRARSG